MAPEDMEKLIVGMKTVAKLKTVERRMQVGERRESTAEHTWACMAIAELLLPFVEESLDRSKVLELILYHDLVEIFAGDAQFNDPSQMIGKEEREHQAFEKIVSILPQESKFSHLYHEYEKRESRESQFAKAIDCVECYIAVLNEDHIVKDWGFTEEVVRKQHDPHTSQFKITRQLADVLIAKIVGEGKY